MTAAGNSPVFPVVSGCSQTGVNRRDWLAAMALSGIVSRGLDVIGDRVVSEQERNLMLARRAYGMADAMLVAAADEKTAVSS